jgi:hypothetical protein
VFAFCDQGAKQEGEEKGEKQKQNSTRNNRGKRLNLNPAAAFSLKSAISCLQ